MAIAPLRDVVPRRCGLPSRQPRTVPWTWKSPLWSWAGAGPSCGRRSPQQCALYTTDALCRQRRQLPTLWRPTALRWLAGLRCPTMRPAALWGCAGWLLRRPAATVPALRSRTSLRLLRKPSSTRATRGGCRSSMWKRGTPRRSRWRGADSSDGLRFSGPRGDLSRWSCTGQAALRAGEFLYARPTRAALSRA